jgi:hypothetical protein
LTTRTTPHGTWCEPNTVGACSLAGQRPDTGASKSSIA